MAAPLLWLGLSIVLLALSLIAMMLMALPTLRELAKAARSAEALFNTLNHELPPTLEALRLTGAEITGLSDGVNSSIHQASHVVKQVDQGLHQAKHQAKQAERLTRSFWVGCKAAWKTLARPARPAQMRRRSAVPPSPHPPASQSSAGSNRPKPILPEPLTPVDAASLSPSPETTQPTSPPAEKVEAADAAHPSPE